MKYLPLVWRNLMRKKIRTTLTLLSIFVAFVLYGLLTALKVAFGSGIDITGADRLVMLNRVSIIQPLPLAYKGRIEAVEGVVRVSPGNWFGGIYQEPRNQFNQFAVDPEAYLAMYPEFILPEEQKEAWFKNRTGVIVGRATAERFGWQVGDRIPLQGTIYRPRDGSNWEFTIEGIYDGANQATDDTLMLLHHDYLEEATGRPGQAGMYIIQIAEPQQAAAIAERIDDLFRNSPAETKTSTEKAFIQAFANQTGNIALIVTSIIAVVFFTLLMVAGNTLAQSVRERVGELAVLKTLGFSDGLVMALVLAESLLLAAAGGLSGLLLIFWATRSEEVSLLGPLEPILPTLYMPADALLLGIAMVVGLGLVTGAVPAFQAMRLKIVDALGRA